MRAICTKTHPIVTLLSRDNYGNGTLVAHRIKKGLKGTATIELERNRVMIRLDKPLLSSGRILHRVFITGPEKSENWNY